MQGLSNDELRLKEAWKKLLKQAGIFKYGTEIEWLIFCQRRTMQELGKLIARKDAGESGGESLTEGYCVKCRAKRPIKNARKVTLKNGKTAVEGTCPVCSTKIFRIG